ncbi:MAG: tetratricopeptide repeat protein [Acidobacteriota bacterium]
MRNPAPRPVCRPSLVLPALLGLALVACQPPPEVVRPDPTQELSQRLRALVDERIAAVESSPRDGERRGRLGLTYLANHLEQQAHDSFVQAELLDSDEALWTYYRAQCLAELGRLEEARTALIDTTRRLPTSSASHLHLGYVELDLGNFEAAQAAFVEAARLQPERPEPLVGQAATLVERDRFDDAETLVRRALLMDSEYAEAHHHLGQVLRAQGKLQDALPHLRRGEDADRRQFSTPWTPVLDSDAIGTSDLVHRAGRLLESNPAEARRLLEEVAAREPDDNQILFDLALAQEQVGDRVTALETLERLRRRDPDFQMINTVMADFHLRDGRHAEALSLARRGVRSAPRDSRARYVLGLVLVRLGRMAEARGEFEQAVEVGSTDIRHRIALAETCAQLGDAPGAIEHFRTAVKQEPTFLPGRLNLVRLLGNAGRTNEALAHLEEARRMAPNHPAVQELTAYFAANR